MQFPLSTRGNQIIDASGSQVLLRGINWFGFELDNYVVNGLWIRDYTSMIKQIADLGYNTIRLPFSNKLFNSGIKNNAIDYTIGRNSELKGFEGLDLLDKIIAEMASNNLMIILDRHRPDPSGQTALWYTDAYPESRWISDWQMLAEHYKDVPQVIGADLHNEPHNPCSWGDGNIQTDWRLAATRCGNAIHQKNPNWLIFIEGCESNIVGYNYIPVVWGSNLQGVHNQPVQLNLSNKIVYSAHDYGIDDTGWDYNNDPNYPANMPDVWQTRWNFVHTENIAPILIGEWGGNDIASTISKEGQWAHTLVNLIQTEKLSFTYWCWNPNTSEKSGILNDDWTTINQGKQNLLQPLLDEAKAIPQPPSPTPIPTVNPSPSPTPSSTPIPTQPATINFAQNIFEANKSVASDITLVIRRTGLMNSCSCILSLSRAYENHDTSAYQTNYTINFQANQQIAYQKVNLVTTGNQTEFIDVELFGFVNCKPGSRCKTQIRLFTTVAAESRLPLGGG